MNPTIASMNPEMRQLARWAPNFTIGSRNLWLMRFGSRLLALFRQAPPGIQIQNVLIPSRDLGRQIRVRIYRPQAANGSIPAMLWMHGGGLVLGTPEQDDAYVSHFVRELGMIVVSVDYRLAPEHPFPAPLEDCYDALQWLVAQADAMSIDRARVAVGGDSAGGGLSAALAQLVHDRGESPLAFQLLIYPMLDDRTVCRTDFDPLAHFVWNNASNRFAWESYLKQACGAEAAPLEAVPGRRADLTGLPPAWLGVGTIDLFHDEDAAYAHRLQEAGVPCELVIVPGAFHAFDVGPSTSPAVAHFRASQCQALRNALWGGQT